MSVIEACNKDEKRGFVLDAAADFGEAAPVASPRRTMQDSAMKISPRPSSDEARAVVWTGILGAAKHIGNRAPLPLRQRPAVVQLRQGNAATPVYFIGAGLYELHIAQLMPSEHSVYAVEIAWPADWHDAAAKNDTHATPILEDMVGPYVAALSAHVGAEPCVLVGYSFHGLMAFEIAHQLMQKGGKVDLVVLVDSPSDYPAAYKIAAKNLRGVWTRAAGTSSDNAPSMSSRLQRSLAISAWTLVEGLRYLKRLFVETALRDPGKLTTKLDTLGRPMQWRLIERLYANSLRAYRLRRLDSRGVVMRGDRPEDCPARAIDFAMGWTGLFGKGLEIIKVTGDHVTMMRQHPHDLHLAEQLSELLDRTYATPAATAPSVSPDDTVTAAQNA
jgi:thioesterase domain-containing protein